MRPWQSNTLLRRSSNPRSTCGAWQDCPATCGQIVEATPDESAHSSHRDGGRIRYRCSLPHPENAASMWNPDRSSAAAQVRQPQNLIPETRDIPRHARPARCWDNRGGFRPGAQPADADQRARARGWCRQRSVCAWVLGSVLSSQFLVSSCSIFLFNANCLRQPCITFRNLFLLLARQHSFLFPAKKNAAELRGYAASYSERFRAGREPALRGFRVRAAGDQNFPAP